MSFNELQSKDFVDSTLYKLSVWPMGVLVNVGGIDAPNAPDAGVRASSLG